MRDAHPLAPYFLGAHGENDEQFERLLVDAVRDHVQWRRAFHPEDLPPLDAAALGSGETREFMRHLQDEMHRLTATLKDSVPFSSPRYIGHMASDLLMPGLLAQLVTTLYNPNNVTSEVAPVTIELEREAIGYIAGMLGFGQRAWGHLTSGGTIANFEGLWHARALRCFPLALARALSAEPDLCALALGDLETADDWTLLNVPVDAALGMLHRWEGLLASQPASKRARLRRMVEEARVEHTGMGKFIDSSVGIRAPVVFVPASAHYSWKKAMQVMGMGSAQLRTVPVDGNMRLDVGALEAGLRACAARREPVIAVVAILGTTEYGTIDPLHEIVALRARHAFCIHADAAWGGYISSVFRCADGSLRPHAEVAADFRYFPSAAVYGAFAALGQADFVTVDPHKLGYLPYGVGAFLSRDGVTRTLVAQQASYVFGDDSDAHTGRYTLEGSRPGAAAAAVCVTHRVLPLHADAFGRLPRRSIMATEYLFDKVRALGDRLRGHARVCIPFEPDTNLICIAVNPTGNRDLGRMNEFMQRLYGELSVEPGMPIQSRAFFGTKTSVNIAALDAQARKRLFIDLGLDPGSSATDEVILLRHTLMNPWLFAGGDDGNYLDRYCDYLAETITALAPGAGHIRRASA